MSDVLALVLGAAAAFVAAGSPLLPELVRWTQQRFAGERATRRCPT